MSSSDTSDVDMKPKRKRVKSTKRKDVYSKDSQYIPPKGHFDDIPPKPKQQGAPKRPMSAYFLYMNAHRDEFKKEHPDLKMIQLTPLIAKEWKEAEDDVKQEYLDDAAERKSKYQAERKKYEASSKYKKYKRDVARWKERYAEEWREQEENKKIYKEEEKKKREARKAKKGKDGKKKSTTKKKATTKKKKKAMDVEEEEEDEEVDEDEQSEDDKENKKKAKKKGRGRPKKNNKKWIIKLLKKCYYKSSNYSIQKFMDFYLRMKTHYLLSI